MTRNKRFLWAVEWLDNNGLLIPDDMTRDEIIEWAENAENNDQWAQEQGYDDIENWAEETGHACYRSGYEPYTEHGREC